VLQYVAIFCLPAQRLMILNVCARVSVCYIHEVYMNIFHIHGLSPTSSNDTLIHTCIYIHTQTLDLRIHTSYINSLSPASSAPSRHRACVADENSQKLALQSFYVATSIASSPLRISTWCMAASGILISLCHK